MYTDRVFPGDTALVLPKHRDGDIPVRGVVKRVLTDKAGGDRGIKVRLRCGTVGRIVDIISRDGDEDAKASLFWMSTVVAISAVASRFM